MDGVLVDLMTPWLAKYNYLWADNLRPRDIKAWDIREFVKPDCGDEIHHMLGGDIFLNAEPYPGAIEFVRQLADTHTVRFASMAWDKGIGAGVGAREKYIWIEEHLPFLGKRQLTLTHYKCSLRGDIMVDDNPAFLEGFRGDKVLFTRPWNKAFHHWEADMIRVGTYSELLLLIKELSSAEAARQRFRLR
jgi:5'(3')-deoxyribonucleotidase